MNEMRRKEETMLKRTKILPVIVLLASAICSFGCEGYRGVATAHIDSAKQFVVTKIEDTADYDVLSQKENEELASKTDLVTESKMLGETLPELESLDFVGVYQALPEKPSAIIPEPTIAVSLGTNAYGVGLRWRM